MEPSPRDLIDPELPKRVGQYGAFLQIGAGGMARVYLGVRHGPLAVKKLVVIKQIRKDVANRQQFLEMFVDEARIAMRLSHPNVVHTYEVVDEAPEYSLVMEFLDGQSLSAVLRRVGRSVVPLHDHLWILTQLLAGLHYAHELRDFDGTPLHIVHQDVTPSNVFICHSGEVKLLDFGIAKVAGAVAGHHNMLKGKLGYISPEQCIGHSAGAASDVYAVGVMLWEAMARRRRVSGESRAVQLQARMQGSEPPIEHVWPEAPPALAAIARRALSLRPQERYASALEFQRELEHYLAAVGSRASAESVRRLLQPVFERDRSALYRVIEAHIGAWEKAPVPEVRRSAPAPSLLSRSRTPSDDEGEADDGRTSRIAVDRALLQATRGELEQTQVEQRAPGAALDPGWRALSHRVAARLSRRRWTSLAAALACALAFGIALARSSSAGPSAAPPPRAASRPLRIAPDASTRPAPAPTPSLALRTARAQPTLTEAHPDKPSASVHSPPAAQPLASPQPAPRSATASPHAARSIAAHVPRTRVATHPAAPAPPPTAALAPGINLRVSAGERIKRRIDEQDPYAP